MTTKQTTRQAVDERQAKELTDAIELVTAMHASLWSPGLGIITDAQVRAAYHDRVLSSLFYRFMDYAEYVSRTRRLHRVAFDDSRSIALEQHLQAYFKASDARAFVEDARQQGLVVPGRTRKKAA